MSVPPRIAFSTLAFPDATLAAAAEVALPQHLDLLATWLESER